MTYKSLCEVIQARGCLDNRGITFIAGEQDEEFVSYKDLFNKALVILYTFQEMGMKPGQELLMQIEDNRAFVEIFWACLLGGIIPVPLAVGNNDEHKLKVFNVWRILNNPFIIATSKTLEGLYKYAVGHGLKILTEEMDSRFILLNKAYSIDGKGKIHTVKPEDIAFIQFSSGSTGEPKGVVLSHANLIANIYAIIKGCEYTSEETTLSWMPLTHDMGLIGFHLSPLTAGTSHYLMPTALYIRRPTLWMKKVSEHNASVISSPNFGYKYFLDFFKPEIAKGWDLSCVRIIFNGAEPISGHLCEKFLNVLSRYGLKENVFFNVYGLAEAGLAVSFPPVGEGLSYIDADRKSLNVGQHVKQSCRLNEQDSLRLVNLGRSVQDCCIRICDESNTVLGDNTVGHIQIKGKNVTSGYYNNPEATKAVITSDGWLNTGDLGFLNKGRLVVTGRAKDIIFINGQNYYPYDIERVAEGVEGVALGEVAACGIHDEEAQKEVVCLFVVFKKELKEFIPVVAGLKEHMGKQLGIDIKEVIPIRKMPKTTSGKIQRYKLGKRYMEKEFVQVVAELQEIFDEIKVRMQEKQSIFVEGQQSSGNLCILEERADELKEVEKAVLNTFKDILQFDEIDVHESFFNLGANSILLGQVYSRLQDQFPGRIAITDVFDYSNVRKLSKYIYGKNTQNEMTKENKERDMDKELEEMFSQMEQGNLSIEQVTESLVNMKGV